MCFWLLFSVMPPLGDREGDRGRTLFCWPCPPQGGPVGSSGLLPADLPRCPPAWGGAAWPPRVRAWGAEGALRALRKVTEAPTSWPHLGSPGRPCASFFSLILECAFPVFPLSGTSF